MDKIELVDESGQLVEFELIDTFGMNDDDFAVFSSLDDPDSIYIFRVDNHGDGEVFFIGVNEEELDDIIEVYEELIEEQEN